MKTILIISAVILTGGIAFSYSNLAASPDILSRDVVADSSEQTQTFAIEKMTCAACPITVKKAMEKVAGVTSVNVNFDSKTATVTFDPSVTTTDSIGQASTNAGYPATLAEDG